MKRHSVSGGNQLLVSAAALIGCVSITNFAHAQSAQPSSQGTALSSGDLMEIVVTAQKRNEKLQEVPISISVVTSGDLDKAGATNNLDLTQLVPGVKIDRVAGRPEERDSSLRSSISANSCGRGRSLVLRSI